MIRLMRHAEELNPADQVELLDQVLYDMREMFARYGSRIRMCHHCDTWFLRGRDGRVRRQKYCSKMCYNRAKDRRRRAREKERRVIHA